MKELADSEQSKYRRVGILHRRARAARFNGIEPGVNKRLVDPEGEATPAAERFVIVFPVTDAIL